MLKTCLKWTYRFYDALRSKLAEKVKCFYENGVLFAEGLGIVLDLPTILRMLFLTQDRQYLLACKDSNLNTFAGNQLL